MRHSCCVDVSMPIQTQSTHPCILSSSVLPLTSFVFNFLPLLGASQLSVRRRLRFLLSREVSLVGVCVSLSIAFSRLNVSKEQLLDSIAGDGSPSSICSGMTGIPSFSIAVILYTFTCVVSNEEAYQYIQYSLVDVICLQTPVNTFRRYLFPYLSVYLQSPPNLAWPSKEMGLD